MLKNKLKYGLVLAGALLLVACGDISVTPSDYEQPLLSDLVSDIERNVASVVYDGLKDGGTLNSKAKDDVINLIAEDMFGKYADNKTSTDPEKIAFMADLNERINEKMYSKITSGSYESRGYFFEERFADFVRKQLYPVNETAGYIEDYVFTPVSKDDILDGTALNPAIHLAYYTEYIEGEIVPEIYRERLIEQYVIDEDYATLGRSYARKVNYIAIAKQDKYPEAAKYLMDTFIDKYILDPTASKDDADLELLARAWRGVDLDPLGDEIALLTDADLTVDKTLNGDILARYNKIDPNPLKTDESIENEFTGNGSHTPAEGLVLKQNDLLKRDFTTDGWFVKTGGLESLPSDIRSRLFNLGVANGVDKAIDEFDAAYDGRVSQKSDYVRNLHGNYYLIPQNSQQIVDPSIPNRDFLLYDAASSTYYIIQILEAVNTTKMNKAETSTTNYDAITGVAGYRENIAHQVAKVLGSRDANKTSAYNHYLKQYTITFHDQDIWEYFKSSFPDVYDDED